MSIGGLLLDLHRRGADLRLEDGRVRCRAPSGALNPDVRARLVRSRDTLADVLRGRHHPRPSLRALANDYRRIHGDGFREAFIKVTGCDFWEVTPSWPQLFIFEAHLRSDDDREVDS